MSSTLTDQTVRSHPLLEGLEKLRGMWWVFAVLGIVLILLGVWAIGAPQVVTLATMTLFGILLLVGGVIELVSAFWTGKWSGFSLQILGGVLRVVVGLILVERPGLTAAAFTLMLAVFLMVGGLFRIAIALSERFPLWGWTILNGAVTLLLGVLIWQDLPEVGLWVIGMFIGIDLVFAGVLWLMVGLTIRRIPSQMG